MAPARRLPRPRLAVLARPVRGAGRVDPGLQLLQAERDRWHRLHVHAGQLRARDGPALPEGPALLAPDRVPDHGDRAGARLHGRVLHRHQAGALAAPAPGADRPPVLDQPADPHVRLDPAAEQRGLGEPLAAGPRPDRRFAPAAEQRVRDRGRAALRVPAADDPAALRVDRAPGPIAPRGGRRPGREPDGGVLPDHVPDDAPRRDGGVHLRVRAEPRELRRARSARRRASRSWWAT